MKRLFFWAMLFFVLPSYAQELAGFLPSDAVLVLRFNDENYGKKIDFDKIRSAKFFLSYDNMLKDRYADSYETVSQIYKNAAQAGVNLAPDSYFFVQSLDSLMSMGYIFGLNDATKFEKFAKSYAQTLGNAAEFGKKGSYQFMKNEDMLLVWNKKMGIVYSITGENQSPDEIDYEDSLYYLKLEQKHKLFAIEKQKIAHQQLQQIFELSPAKSLFSHINFKEFLKQKSDIGAWLNLEKFNKVYSQKVSSMAAAVPYFSSYMEFVNSFYTNSFWHLYLHLQNGEAVIESAFHTNPKLAKAMEGLYSQRLDPALFGYINGKKIVGLGAISLNTKVFAQNFWDIYKSTLNKSEDSEKIIAVLDLLDIIIDEKSLTELLAGDVLFAVNDVKEVEVSYTSYEYDEDYNMITIEKTKKEKVPIFSLVAKVGNKANIDKIVKALVNFKVAIPEGEYYRLQSDKKTELYLLLKNNILLVCNDEKLLQNAIKGVEVSQQIPAEFQKQVLASPQFYYINLEEAFLEAEKAFPNPSVQEKIVPFRKNLKEINAKVFEPVGTVSKAEIRLIAKDNTQNILNLLIDLADQLNTQSQEDSNR